MGKRTEYTVEIAIDTLRPLTEECLLALASIGGAASGNVGSYRIETTLTVEATDPASAIGQGLDLVMGKVKGTVAGASAMTIEEFDRREEERASLVGVAEVAGMLGITRQRVTTLSKRDDFPAPLTRLCAGPVWRAGDLSTFAEGWQRKAGRPRKVAAG